MLSEAAHSFADTVTEVLLFVALKRGEKRPDEKHPFGYGRETYFWAFLASLMTFLVGAGFSIFQGISTILSARARGTAAGLLHRPGRVSFVLEGISFRKAVKQVRGAAQKWGVSPRQYLAADDGHHGQGGHVRGRRGAGRPRPGRARPPPRAAHRRPALGRRLGGAHRVLLIVVAYILAPANKSLLIGQSASPRIEQRTARGDRRARPRGRRAAARSPRSSGPERSSSRPRSTSTTTPPWPTSRRSRTRPSSGWSPGTRACSTSSSIRLPATAARTGAGPPAGRKLNAQGIAGRLAPVRSGMQVEVWSDVVWPWCYIGKRRLESAARAVPAPGRVEVVWRSFQLDPSVPEGETHPTLPALAAKYGARVDDMRSNMAHAESSPPPRAWTTISPTASAATPCSPTSCCTSAAEHGHAQRAQGAPAARLLPGAALGLRRRVARAVRGRGGARRGRGPRSARRPALPGRRSAGRRHGARHSVRPASPSLSSTGSTAPRALSRPNCSSRSSSGPGTDASPHLIELARSGNRQSTVPAADGCTDDSCAV